MYKKFSVILSLQNYATNDIKKILWMIFNAQMKTILFAFTLGLLCLALFLNETFGQEIPDSIDDPFEIFEYHLNSGVHNGNSYDVISSKAFQTQVSKQGAQWIRLIFDSFELGENSYITITSKIDNSWQRLDAESMVQWGASSAYFNGDLVEITLHVGPTDKNIFFELKEIKAGVSTQLASDTQNKKINSSSGLLTLTPCVEGENDFPEDTRIFSQDPAVGRFHHVAGHRRETGYLISNSAILTAGHGIGQFSEVTELIQFNVPKSGSDGSTVHAHPNDQYPVDISRLEFNYGSIGNDWAIVGLFPNSNTGLTAAVAQDAYYRLAKEVSLSSEDSVRITGFGADATPSGTGFENSAGVCPNSGHKAQQTAVGYRNINVNQLHWWDINTSASGGVSGSPLILEDFPSLAIGIQTHGFNSLYGVYLYERSGVQKFSQPTLLESINNFPGINTFYVDSNYPAIYSKGSQGNFFNPYSTVEDAVVAASSGGIVSIVAGHYPADFTIEVNSGTLTLEAPVGNVTIGGNSGPSKMANIAKNESSDANPNKFNLSHNYPNPFNPTTVIEYTLPEKVKVQLVIYDVLGRRVTTLIDQVQQSGTHIKTWDASNFASGVYIYRIHAGDFVQSKKMLLIK